MPRTILSELVVDSFRYLFDEFGFSVVHAEDFARDYGNSIAVLQSAECRVRILLERGRIFVEVGPLQAPLDWATQAPNLWFDTSDVISFLTDGATEWDHFLIDYDLSVNSDISNQLKAMSAFLRRFIKDVIHLFEPVVFEKHQAELVEFRKRRTDLWLRSLYRERAGQEVDPPQ